MTDTCGPTWQMPFAYYDPDTSSVRTSQATFPWDSTPSSPTLPPWGSMRGGELYERPTPAPLTAARDYSSSQLLPTSRATDGDKGGPNQVNGRGVRDSLPGLVPTLLPTPTAQAAKHGSTPDTTANGYGSNLWDLPTLLPTPTTQDAHNNGGPSQRDRNSLPLNALVPLLPTPAVNDMGRGKTPEQRDEWTAKMQASHSNGNGHGKSLEIEAQRLWEEQ